MAKKKTIAVENENQENGEIEEDAVKDAGDTKTDEDPADPVLALEEKLASAESEAKEHYDKLLRASAELENYKKRASREISEIRKYAAEALISDLLSVVDNLERAVNSTDNVTESGECIVEGVNLTLAEILKIFEKYRVVPIESLGKAFDPNFHQAISQEESIDDPPNQVLREFQKGYMIHDRLLRPAMVVVSKAAAKEKKKA